MRYQPWNTKGFLRISCSGIWPDEPTFVVWQIKAEQQGTGHGQS